MRTRRTGVLLALCTWASVAAAAGAQNTVSGKVHFADTGEPASGINLWLKAPEKGIGPVPQGDTYDLAEPDPPQPIYTKVAPDGSFTLHDVPPGQYIVHTYSPFYLSPDGTLYPVLTSSHVAAPPMLSPGALTVTVVADRPTPSLDIHLQRGGTIEGTVRAANAAQPGGAPVAGAALTAMRKLSANSYANQGGAAHSDAQGHFRLDALAPGDYIVLAGRGYELPVYASSGVRPSLATVVHIAGVEAQHVDLTLPDPARMYPVEGKVIVQGSKPFNGAMVRLLPVGEAGPTASGTLSPEKTFRFESVPDGDYTLEIQFLPASELLGLDPVQRVMRLRVTKSAYAAPPQTIHVAGGGISGIVFTAQPR